MRNHSTTTSANHDSFRRIEVITGVGRRRRWTDEEKARIVAESLDPATTSSAVARRYGLHASQLFVWRQQLHRGTSSAAGTIAGPGFVPVLVAEGGAPPAEAVGRTETLAEEAAEAAERLLVGSEMLAAQAGRWAAGRHTVVALGRGPARAASEMGALVLKESAWIAAEALEAGQFRHGPL